MSHRHLNLGLIIATFVALIDQFSKKWIVNDVMVPPHTVPVTSFFNLVLNWNKGVTFGLFNRNHPWMSYVFIAAAIIILFLLVRWLARATSWPLALGLGLVIGGAVGNVIDRLQYGAVIDFLDFYWGTYHWYTFNLADSAIVGGVLLLMLENMVKGGKRG